MLFSAPVSLPGGETGILHMSLKKPSRGLNDMTFAMGLAGIGVLIAAMLFPLYRFISRPLSELKAAAIGISEGNLSARAGIRSSDEIGELASAFNRMAENVERMVKSTRELTANISHELRSPLARIQVAGELLDEKLGQPENARRYLESIREETAEIDRLIGDILMLSRLDMNAANTKVTEFDLTAALKELVGRWVASAEHAGLSMEMNIPDKSVIIRAGRDDIMRAIDSLIANAVKFTPENGIVSVRLEDTGHAVMTRVRNTCAPLSPEQLEKIFEPFYRIPGGASQGTGLGLTIARRIAVNVGGSLTVSSWEQGIEMTLSIPALGKN
jgi:two-component system sensor histidine kinase CpxA